MGKNSSKPLGKMFREIEVLSPLQDSLVSISNNSRAELIINVKTYISDRTSDGKMIHFAKYLSHYHAYGKTVGMVNFYAIVAQNGAAFTAGNIPFTTDLREGLDSLIDKPFQAFKLGTIHIETTSLAIASDEYHTAKRKTFNWVNIFNRVAKITKSDELSSPEVWIIAIETSAEAANTTIIEAEQEISFDVTSRKGTIGF